MFFELRTYDLKPGRAPAYLEFFRTYGLSRVTRHLPMMGYWLVETGRLNRIEHMWAYESFAERDACRAGLVADEEWMTGFVPEAFVDVIAQENRILSLDESSDAFDAAVLNRKKNHPDDAKGSPMFASGLQSLSIGDGLLDSGGRVAGFTVISGPNSGSRVTLNSGEFEELCKGTSGTQVHEILRPLSLSPLQ